MHESGLYVGTMNTFTEGTDELIEVQVCQSTAENFVMLV